MPRRPRHIIPDQPVHVVQRGHDRRATFIRGAAYTRYLQLLGSAATRHGCVVHGYALMPNHVHLLLTPSHPHALECTMRCLGTAYVRYFNKRNRRVGTLWQGRYHASAIDSERYLLACLRYIELNPVRARLARNPSDWPWSSYAASALGAADPLVRPHPVYEALAATTARRQAAYRALFATDLDEATLMLLRRASRANRSIRATAGS